MSDSKLLRLSPRGCAIGVLVGFAIFLVGAQLPYDQICLQPGKCFPAERLIDLTPNPGSNHDAWAVSRWLVRLVPALVAATLIYLPTPIRRRAAGFLIFLALYLIALFLLITMPFIPRDGWQPGTTLAPLGAVVMLISGWLAARVDPAGEKESDLAPWKLWFPLIVLGMTSMGVAVAIGSQEMAYVFTLGATATLTGLLLARAWTAHGSANRSGGRWTAAPLLIGSALWAASSFVPWGPQTPFPTIPIRMEFLFRLTTPDFWEAVALMVVLAGPLLASVRVLWRGSAGELLLGGAIAGSYWTLTLLSAALRHPRLWEAAPGVYLASLGVMLMLIGVVYLALRDVLSRRSEASAREVI